MPPEPLPWDRKDFFKERKHERSESLGSVARWRDSSHHRDFNRWGSAEFRRPPGHGKQGAWHLFSEESGHGYAISRSSSGLEEDSRPSILRGDGKYGRSSRENRGPFCQRDWRGHSWEPSNGTLHMPRRPQEVNNDQRSVDDALPYSSHPHSDFGNAWDQHHLKDQHDKMGGINGLGTGSRYDRENSLADWKPLKWSRSGSLSSRGSGFSHSSSSRSMGGADSHEVKAELQPKSAAANEPHSGEAAACATSVPPEDTTSRKKPRLNWGEGLAKYEKKKVEVPDATTNKDGPVLCNSNTEPCNFLSPSLVDKSPKVTGFSECASPATPSSVACSSSPGMDDKLFGKTANVDNDVSNLTGSPAPVSENHLPKFSFNLKKFDIGSLNNLGSSIIELVKSDDPTAVDSGPLRSNAINKLLIWKADISKVLEMTESEIDLLENELKSLKSESGKTCPCPVALDSQMVGSDKKSYEEHVGVSDQFIQPVLFKIADDPNTEKMPLSTNLHSIHENGKEDDIDSPGTATSKFVEPLPLIKEGFCDTRGCDNFSRDLDAVQSTAVKCLVPCITRKDASVAVYVDDNTSMELKDSMDSLYKTIISSNKESANRASEVFDKLLSKDCCKIENRGASSDTCTHTFIMEKFAEKKRFAIFKERVIALKFRALHHLWREDMRLLSIRKYRPKSHKKNELSVRTSCNGNQKNRSSIRSRFPFPAGNHLSLVPTSEIINFTSKLLSESQVKVLRNDLKMPALILDDKEKMVSKFVSSNGLVEDPLAIEEERAMINPWTLEEREVFLEKFAAFGKDFRKIASFLDHKTTADCVEFYYKNHKSDCFEKLKKQDVGKLGKSFSAKTDMVASGKKWNRELNAASLDILSAASLMADGIAGNKKMRAGSSLLGGYGKAKASRGGDLMEKSSSFDILGDERETAAAADVLAGICGSLSSEAMSSCITNSVDPVEGHRDRKFLKVNAICKPPMTPDISQDLDDETCSDESCGEMDPTDWTDDEKVAFLQAVSSFGKDFANIARYVGTRSQEQCKVFFSKGRKCLGLDLMRPIPENVGSPVNDDANGGESDTDDACVVETGSVVGTDKSGTKTDEDMPLYGTNTYHDESNTVEARNLSTELKETNGLEEDHEEANVVSDACQMDIDSKQGCDGRDVVLCGSDKFGSVSGQAAIFMSDSSDIGKDKSNKLGGAGTELISAPDTCDPCESNSIAENRVVVSEVSSGGLGNELDRKKMSSSRCLDDKDNKQEADSGVSVDLKSSLGNELERKKVSSSRCLDDGDNKQEADSGVAVDLKTSVHDLSTLVNASHSSLGNLCSGLSSSTENKHVPLGKPHVSPLSMEYLHSSNSLLQNTVAADVQCDKTASQDRLSSNCDIQGSRDMHCQSSISNGDHQLSITGNSLDHVILQGYSLQVPVKNELNDDMNSATELPLLSQKIEQTDDHNKTFQSSDSDQTSRNGDVKLFGKILTNPSSAQKPNVGAKGTEESGTHHPKLSSKSSSLKFAGHHNSADGNLKILKFDRNDYVHGLENVPKRSYGYWDGNRIQTGFSALPDSAILLAKYPAAFSNYPTSSAILEQSPLQAFSKNNERLLNSANTFTSRDTSGSNAVMDYQMFRRDGSKENPYVVDVFSEMQRRNGFEAISGLQQQGKGIMGVNGVGRPGILVGGSCSGVSDPVAAIKMHYSNSDKYGGQTGSIAREDESWGGKGD